MLASALAFAAGPASAALDDPCLGRLPHPPIEILGNEGPQGIVLAWDSVTGAPLYRPGSGVFSGRGTAEDPFLIEGLCVLGQTVTVVGGRLSANGIVVSQTTSHLVLRDNLVSQIGDPVDGAGFAEVEITPNDGISIFQAPHVAVVGNVLTDGYGRAIRVAAAPGVVIDSNVIARYVDGAIHVDSSPGAAIRANNVRDIGAYQEGGHAIRVTNSPGVAIVENTVVHAAYAAIESWNSDGTLVADNVVEHVPYGPGVLLLKSDDSAVLRNSVTGAVPTAAIKLDRSNRGLVEGNVMTGNGFGFATLGGTTRNVVRANVIRDSTDAGVWIAGQGHEFTDNDVIGSGIVGLYVLGVGSTVHRNLVAGAADGVWVVGASFGNSFRGNAFLTDGVGFDATANDFLVDARENWWGCVGGPGAQGCSTAAGNVRVDPWLVEPAE